MSYPLRMQYARTRSGLGPALVPDAAAAPVLPIVYCAPKPAWMDHIPGSLLVFHNRAAWLAHIG